MIDFLVCLALTAVAEGMLENQAAAAAVVVAELSYRRLVRSSHLSQCQSEILSSLVIPSAKLALAEAEETELKKILKGEALMLEMRIQMLRVGLASGDSEVLAELDSAADPLLADCNETWPWRLQL